MVTGLTTGTELAVKSIVAICVSVVFEYPLVEVLIQAISTVVFPPEVCVSFTGQLQSPVESKAGLILIFEADISPAE